MLSLPLGALCVMASAIPNGRSVRSFLACFALTQVKHAASGATKRPIHIDWRLEANPAKAQNVNRKRAGPAEQFPCLYKQIVSVLMHTAVSCGHLKKKQHDGVGLLVSIWAQLAGYRSGAAGRRLGVSVICLYRSRRRRSISGSVAQQSKGCSSLMPSLLGGGRLLHA